MLTSVRAVVRVKWSERIAVLLVSVLTPWLPMTAAAETSAGLTVGAALAGNQDFGVNLLPPRPEGRRLLTNLSADTGAIAGMAVTDWPDTWRWFGVGADALWWNTPVTVKRGNNTFDLGQTRSALLVQPLARYWITDETFLYGGPGGGFAYTTVRHGSDKLGAAVSVLTGIAIPLTQSLRLRFEAQYLATHDADAARTPSQRVDVSGNQRRNPAHVIFGAHLDTQFVPLRVGLDWVFR